MYAYLICSLFGLLQLIGYYKDGNMFKSVITDFNVFKIYDDYEDTFNHIIYISKYVYESPVVCMSYILLVTSYVLVSCYTNFKELALVLIKTRDITSLLTLRYITLIYYIITTYINAFIKTFILFRLVLIAALIIYYSLV